jgi:outer membrane protein TolC
MRHRNVLTLKHSVFLTRVLPLIGAGLVLGIFCGCSASRYARRADHDVYQIIHRTEQRVLGHTNEFSIDTSYSKRNPKDIKPPELVEDRMQTNSRVLTLEDALRLAAQSRRYQTEKERLYLSALTLTGARHEFRPQITPASSSATANRTTRDEWYGIVDNRLSVSQLLQTGGSISMSLINDVMRYYTGDPRLSVVSTLSVNIAQPLLRGFGRNNTAVESLTQAVRNVVYAVRNYSYFQDQFAMEVVNDYFVLLEQKDNIRNRYTNYLGRLDFVKRFEARSRDRESLIQVDQARQAALTSKDNYVNAVAAYKNSLDQFKITLGLPLSEKWQLDDSALEAVKKAGLVDVNVNSVEAFRVAVEKQSQILNAIDQYEDVQRKVRIAANRLKADFNFVADASWKADPFPDYTRFSLTNLTGGVGFELNLPIERLTERNSYRASLISFESELRDLTLTLDNLRDSIERGLRTLEQRRQNLAIQQAALTNANRQVSSASLLLQAGRAIARDLVDAQDAQISAQNQVTSAMLRYQEARLQLMLMIGALRTDIPQFWLKDHLEGFLPAGSGREAQRAKMEEDNLITPEEFFRN